MAGAGCFHKVFLTTAEYPLIFNGLYVIELKVTIFAYSESICMAVRCLVMGVFALLTVSLYGQSKEREHILLSADAAYHKGEYRRAKTLYGSVVSDTAGGVFTKEWQAAANGLGNVCSQLGEIEPALTYYLLSISRKVLPEDAGAKARTYKNIGSLYSEQKDFGPALHYYGKARELATASGDRMLMADCLNNIAVVYEQQRKWEAAKEYYNQALETYRSLHNRQRISMVLNNLAIVYKVQGMFDQSISQYKEALAIAQQDEDLFTIAATHNNLGNVYAAKGEFKKALAMCRLALEEARKADAKEVVVASLDGMAEAYESMGMYPEALQHRKMYEKELQDYINAQRAATLAEMNTRFETQEKDAAILRLQQQKEINKLRLQEQQLSIRNRNLWLAGSLIFMLVAGLALWFRRGREQVRAELVRQEAVRQTEEQERLRIARDIHDDLGSGLSKINFLSEIIQQKTAMLPELASHTAAVRETSTRMIGNMRDLIWALNPENTTLANLVARMREYMTDYLEEHPVSVSYSIPDNMPATAITKECHRELVMVLKEALNNIVKHAGATSVHLEVTLSDTELMIRMEDNGKGIEAGPSGGNGLMNMKRRTESVCGTFSIGPAARQGTEIRISVPLATILKSGQ